MWPARPSSAGEEAFNIDGAAVVGIIVALAAFWLIARFIELVSRPRHELEAALGITRPHTFQATIDQLGSSFASVRILNCGKRRFVVRVANQVIESERGQERVMVRGLEPDTSYSGEVQRLGGNSRDIGIVSRFLFHTLTADESKNYNPKAMSIRLGRGELRELRKQAEEGIADERKKVLEKLQELGERRKIEEGRHASLKAELALLEDQKHALELKRAKLVKQSRDLTDLKAAKEQRFAALNARRDDLETHLRQLESEYSTKCELLDAEQAAHDRALKNLQESLNHAQNELKLAHEREISIRQVADRLRHADAFSTSVQSTLLAEIIPSLQQNLPKQHQQATIDRVKADFELDARLDREYVARQTELEERYMTAYQDYENAARALQRETSQAQARARVQASAQAKIFAATASSRHSLDSLNSMHSADTPISSRPSLAGSLRIPSYNSPEITTDHDLRRPSQADGQISTPSAGGLLPSNLFQDYDEDEVAVDDSYSGSYDTSIGAPHNPEEAPVMWNPGYNPSRWNDTQSSLTGPDEPHSPTTSDGAASAPDTPSKMFKRGIGRGLFHLDSSKGKNGFVRRLSLFARRDAESDKPAASDRQSETRRSR